MPDLGSAFKHLDGFAGQWMKNYDMPGLVIGVTDREELLWESTYGLSDLGTQAPVTPDTLFEIGSLGKPFTNVALLRLRDEGKFDPHTPVSEYLPWFQVRSQFAPITAHYLMSQTAGIIQGTDLAPHGLYEAWSLSETRAGAPPGEMCSYSNVGYKVLGFLLERLTGQSFQEAIQSRVLDPLGMAKTHPVITFETRKKAATGYTYFYDDRPEHPSHGLVPAIWSESGTGDGCQASTAGDMAKYLRMLLNRGRIPGGCLMSEESFSLMTQRVIWTGNDYYGYGLVTYPADSTVIGHGGKSVGCMSAIVIDLDSGFGVVTLGNRTGEADATLQLARYVLAVVRAAHLKEDLPLLPPPNDPCSIPSARDYAGVYRSDDCVLHLTAEDGELLLKHDGKATPLERRAQDSFYVGHPDFKFFLLEFKRQDGKVVEAFHGSHWYTNERYSGPRRFDYPQEWDAYVGHYRARNPQVSNFRVGVRKGALVVLYPAGGADPLRPLGGGLFQMGEDHRMPDTMRFDAVVEGRALLADYCGCPYFRAFTP